MRFLHLSDIHFLRNYPKAESGYNSIFNNITSPLTQIKRCIDRIDLKEIAFIIITGDLVESGDFEDYKVLRENLNEIFGDTPYIVTLGNHDNKEAFYKGWFDKEANEEAYNHVEEIAGVRIVSFDNSQYKNSNGMISEKQKKWLKKVLSKDTNKDTILMIHHHILKEQFVTPSVEVDEEFEEIIKSSSVIGVFSGHTHHPYNGVFAGKPYFTARSLSFIGINEEDGTVRFEEAAGFNLCTYTDGNISIDAIDVLEERKILGYVKF